MALTGCYAVLKFLLFIFNFIFWLVGLTILVFTILLLTDKTSYLSITEDDANYYTGLYILLAAGALIFIVAFLGCCGAYRESPCMLVSFFCFLLIILVAEIAAGAWAYSNSDRLKELVSQSVTATVQADYGTAGADSRTATFDAIQSGLKCCGASGPGDWANSKFNMRDKNIVEVTIKKAVNVYNIPASCCIDGISKKECEEGRTVILTAAINRQIYSEGCIDKLIELLQQYANILMGVGLALVTVEVLGLVFSLVLCCAVRSEDRYKA